MHQLDPGPKVIFHTAIGFDSVLTTSDVSLSTMLDIAIVPVD